MRLGESFTSPMYILNTAVYINRIMKFVANFLKAVYYILKILNFDP